MGLCNICGSKDHFGIYNCPEARNKLTNVKWPDYHHQLDSMRYAMNGLEIERQRKIYRFYLYTLSCCSFLLGFSICLIMVMFLSK